MPLRQAVETQARLARRPTERRFFDLEPTSDLVQKLYAREREDRRLREQRRERSHVANRLAHILSRDAVRTVHHGRRSSHSGRLSLRIDDLHQLRDDALHRRRR